MVDRAIARRPLARLAGEAFTTITGVDLALAKLESTRPEGYMNRVQTTIPPTKTSNSTGTTICRGRTLRKYVPGMCRIKTTVRGVRHMLGKTNHTPDMLQQTLRQGRQRQRAAAALELSLKKKGTPLWEVRAPGFRQVEWLGC